MKIHFDEYGCENLHLLSPVRSNSAGAYEVKASDVRRWRAAIRAFESAQSEMKAVETEWLLAAIRKVR